jgi:uncharacterized membrane protein (DUF485 family)
MGWFLLILVLLAAAFGVLGAVIKVTAVVVFSILFTIAVLITLGVLAVKYGWWKTNKEIERRLSTPRRDDRY